MDGFEEKKWFVYLGDHHEGPFSLSEIQSKLDQGQVTPATYVWAEGMIDWQLMREVAAFDDLSKKAADLAGPHSSVTLELDVSAMNTSQMEFGRASNPVSQATVASAPAPSEPDRSFDSSVQLEIDRRPLQRFETQPGPNAQRNARVLAFLWSLFKKLVLVGMFAGIIIAGKQGYFDPYIKDPRLQIQLRTLQEKAEPVLSIYADRFPFLKKWISPFSRAEDMSPEDFQALQEAALTSMEARGPVAALALSNADVYSPTFYVASNLPDGARFDLYLKGVPDTLLDQTRVEIHAMVTVESKLGKSAPVKLADGKPLPRGEYKVYATESPQQPDEVKPILASATTTISTDDPLIPKGNHLLVRKVFFLGGPQDPIYAAQLKEYHDKLRDGAQKELLELKQFALTLETQFVSTSARFRALQRVKARPLARRKMWASFHGQWAGLQRQMSAVFEKWSPDALKNQYFYGMLYGLTRQAGMDIGKLHTLQGEYVDGKGDARSLEIQVGQASAVAQSTIANLKSKIDLAEKTPPSPGGLPRKEGL